MNIYISGYQFYKLRFCYISLFAGILSTKFIADAFKIDRLGYLNFFFNANGSTY